jgi:hypothetical protein
VETLCNGPQSDHDASRRRLIAANRSSKQGFRITRDHLSVPDKKLIEFIGGSVDCRDGRIAFHVLPNAREQKFQRQKLHRRRMLGLR